ncbi:MAG: FeoC-like transcriptional regulator [Propionibacteriaceae bacterium]|jgi:hypothetical protein|nr:FeoC-like transcriptional regulator [Propionibacteriaceae bacterium]
MSGVLLLAPGSRSLASTGPLGKVLAAVRDGANSVIAIQAATQLSRDLVEAALEHLRRTGRFVFRDYAACATSGCGACPTASTCN